MVLLRADSQRIGGVPLNNKNNTIAHCEYDELLPGAVGNLFQSGAKAVVLGGDTRIESILSSLTAPINDESHQHVELNPWHSKLVDMARNHQPGNPDSGDVIRFIPGKLSHVARKITIRRTDSGELKTDPEVWILDGQDVRIPRAVLRDTWQLMTEILHSVLPEGDAPEKYYVNLEILNYPRVYDDVESIFNLLVDSGGRWTKFGHQLDYNKSRIAGPLDFVPMNHLLSLLMMVPHVGDFIRRVNERLRLRSVKATVVDEELIADPHMDKVKILTALCGARANLRTELRADGAWLEMPITAKELAIFPSNQVTRYSNIESTLHRVVMRNQEPKVDSDLPNVTLSMSVISEQDL